jgi:hypothetical protein
MSLNNWLIAGILPGGRSPSAKEIERGRKGATSIAAPVA